MSFRLRIYELNTDNSYSLTDHFFAASQDAEWYVINNSIEHYELRDAEWKLLAEKDLDKIRYDQAGGPRKFVGPIKLAN